MARATIEPEHGFEIEGRADRAADRAQRFELRQGPAQLFEGVAEGGEGARHRADLVGPRRRDRHREIRRR